MKTEFQIGKETVSAELTRCEATFTLKVLERELQGELLRWEPPYFSVRHCGHVLQGAFYQGKDFIDVHLPKGNFRFRLKTGGRRGSAAHAPGSLSSPMPGKVIKVLVKAGDKVKAGDLLMVLEAMKMEHKVVSPQDGVVKKVHFAEGERVGQEVELVEIK